MSRFLKNVVLFALIILCCLAAGELVVRHMDTSYTYKADFIRKQGDKVSTLILGSSHTYYGLRPDILGDSVFNLANVSQTPEYDLALLRQFSPYMPNLKRIILPMSYFTFRDPLLEEIDRGLAVQYKVGMGLDVHRDLSIYNLAITDFKSYTGRLRSLLLTVDMNRCDSLGFGLGFDLSHRDGGWKEAASGRARSLTFEAPERVSEVGNTINEILAFCRRKNINCIFVTTPVWRGFREAMDSTQYAEMLRLAEKISSAEGVRYYNFFDSPAFGEDDFHDADHLSDIGAARLSRLLKERGIMDKGGKTPE